MFFLSCSLCFGQEIKIIKKGAPAPFDGFVVDAKQMKVFRQIDKDRKVLKEKEITLKDLGVVQEKRIKYFQDQADFYQTEMQAQQVKGWFKNTVYFLGGVAITGLISYGAWRVYR